MFFTTKVSYLTLKGTPSTITDKKWTYNIYGLNHQQMTYINTQAMYIYDTFFYIYVSFQELTSSLMRVSNEM
jgi:hypothetical protein